MSDEKAPWSPFRKEPGEVGQPRAQRAFRCPSCGFTVHQGDRIKQTREGLAHRAPLSRGPKPDEGWQHGECPS